MLTNRSSVSRIHSTASSNSPVLDPSGENGNCVGRLKPILGRPPRSQCSRSSSSSPRSSPRGVQPRRGVVRGPHGPRSAPHAPMAPHLRPQAPGPDVAFLLFSSHLLCKLAIRRPGAAARRRRRPSPPTRRARRTLVPVRRRNVSISRRKAGGEGRGSDEGQHPVGGLEPQPSAAQAGLNLPPIYTCKGEHAGHAAGEVFGRERQRRVGSFMLQVLSAHDLDPPGSYAGSSLPRHRVYACPAPTL